MSERKLASIQRITALTPIKEADFIEAASVLGWTIICKKGLYNVGDLAVYFEIDSVPPDLPEYEFLWQDKESRPNSFRIRSKKMKGVISQGLLMPLHELLPTPRPPLKFEEGQDLTEVLSITKYEPPLPQGSNDIVGQFIDGVPKTDEPRIQSNPKLLEALQDRPYYITVKADGASVTCAMHEDQFTVASRNYRLKRNEDSPYWRGVIYSNIEKLVTEHPSLAVQGELVGPGVQDNKLKLHRNEVQVFNIYGRTTQKYLTWSQMKDLCLAYNVPTVELVETGKSFEYSQDELLALAEGKYPNTKSEREGIVIRNNDTKGRVSFKAISNRFLLKNEG